jgi:hypothetical protein
MFLAHFLHNRGVMKNNLLHHILETSGCTIVAVLLLTSPTARGDLIPGNRLIDWTQSGVPGGIPVVSTVYTTLAAGASSSAIQSALDACPSNQVVLLSSGTYTVTQMIRVRKTGVVLRGAGRDSTILTSALNYNMDDATVEVGSLTTGSFFVNSPVNDGCQGFGVANSNAWVAGFSQGATSITVQSSSGIQVGQLLGLDQVADGSNVYSSAGCRNDGPSNWAFRGCGTRDLQQVVRVTAINGNVLTIEPGLFSPFWSASQNPQVFWASGTSGNIYHAGVESMTINCGSLSTMALCFVNAYACWGKDVRLQFPNLSHLGTTFDKNCEFRHGVISDFQLNNSGYYGVELRTSSQFRFEDNIISNYDNAVTGAGVSGMVCAYNYFTNDVPGSVVGNPSDNLFLHNGHGHFNLFEGNYVRSQIQDCLYGGGSYQTDFRNVITGYEGGNNGWAIRFQPWNYYFSAVGNLLGTTGRGMDFEGLTGNDIWCFGDYNGAWQDTRTDDPRVTNTLVRVGNWDAVNGTIVWGTNTVQTITNSLAYASKPSWWGSGTWPPFDPNNASAANRTNIPAGYRYVNGVDPPAGAVSPPPAPANLIVQ